MTDIEAINRSIRALRRADRWRWRKRNCHVISMLMIIRLRLLQAETQ
jgi:hypothetical protein